MVRKKRDGGNRVVIVRMPVLSRPFLINIAFALEFYSPSFSIRCFPAPETYCIAVSIQGNTVYKTYYTGQREI